MQPESGGRMGKRKYYFPPKAEKKPITISDDVKEELKKLAVKYALTASYRYLPR